MAAIYRALGGPWDLAADIEGSVPDRTYGAIAQCTAVVGDENDYEYEAPCPFAGPVTVLVYEDTEEAFWYCPNDHENSMPWSAP